MVWQWDNSISYDRIFGKHKINALFSTSATQTDRDYTYATGKGYGTDRFSYYNIGASYKTDERSIGSDFVTATLMSYVVRADYNYASKYYLTAPRVMMVLLSLPKVIDGDYFLLFLLHGTLQRRIS